MRSAADEVQVVVVPGRRKGRDQAPCEIGVCVWEKCEVLLRTEDQGGIAPIVVVLDPAQVRKLMEGLAAALEQIGGKG